MLLLNLLVQQRAMVLVRPQKLHAHWSHGQHGLVFHSNPKCLLIWCHPLTSTWSTLHGHIVFCSFLQTRQEVSQHQSTCERLLCCLHSLGKQILPFERFLRPGNISQSASENNVRGRSHDKESDRVLNISSIWEEKKEPVMHQSYSWTISIDPGI